MAGHIAAVSALMILGKMFPLFCYRDEADWQTRLALSLGMCPRGEVGAGIIVISIHAGISGPAVELAVVCLVINLVLSGAFVTWTRQLTRASQERVAKLKEEAARAKAERRKAKGGSRTQSPTRARGGGRARTGERPSPKRSLHPQRSSGHCGARVASGHYERGAWCG